MRYLITAAGLALIVLVVVFGVNQLARIFYRGTRPGPDSSDSQNGKE